LLHQSQGVKLGGLLVQMLNSVTIKCKPAEIPEFLEIDVTSMEMNTNLFVKDITLPSDVELITADDIAVVSVQEPKQEAEEDIEVADEVSSESDDSDSSSDEKASDEQSEESSETSGDKE
jgi:large subunit ribosomal protein L25